MFCSAFRLCFCPVCMHYGRCCGKSLQNPWILHANVAWKLETKMEIFGWYAEQLRVVLLIDLVWRFGLINLGRNWFATVNVISVTKPDQGIPRRWSGNWPFTSTLNPVDSQDIWQYDFPVCAVLCVRVSADYVLCSIPLFCIHQHGPHEMFDSIFVSFEKMKAL